MESVKESIGRRPVIGIPAAMASPSEAGYVYQQVGAPYVRVLEEAGAVPVLLPVSQNSELIGRIMSMVDGILLQGGGDISPPLYGQEQHPEVKQTNEATDRFEIEIARRCVEANKPLLGICRGVQVLNVALGGTLIQDIPSQRPTLVGHRQNQPRHDATHRVSMKEGSKLEAILGHNELLVNSFHHQAIDEIGTGLSVSAWSEDELVEGLELPDRDFVVAVQFHPEETTATVRPTANLFKALVEAAQKSRTKSKEEM